MCNTTWHCLTKLKAVVDSHVHGVVFTKQARGTLRAFTLLSTRRSSDLEPLDDDELAIVDSDCSISAEEAADQAHNQWASESAVNISSSQGSCAQLERIRRSLMR